MSYLLKRIEDLVEGEDVVAFGAHVVKWRAVAPGHFMLDGEATYAVVPAPAQRAAQPACTTCGNIECPHHGWEGAGTQCPQWEQAISPVPEQGAQKVTGKAPPAPHCPECGGTERYWNGQRYACPKCEPAPQQPRQQGPSISEMSDWPGGLPDSERPRDGG